MIVEIWLCKVSGFYWFQSNFNVVFRVWEIFIKLNQINSSLLIKKYRNAHTCFIPANNPSKTNYFEDEDEEKRILMMFSEVQDNHVITVLVYLLKLHYSICMLFHVIICIVQLTNCDAAIFRSDPHPARGDQSKAYHLSNYFRPPGFSPIVGKEKESSGTGLIKVLHCDWLFFRPM